jgi:hypothetical protein
MKITKRQLRRIIKECMVNEGMAADAVDWLKNKASAEYDEAKFRALWEKELLTTINPGTKYFMEEIDIEGKKGERIAKAWVNAGHEKFTKAATQLKEKQLKYFSMYVNAIGYGGVKWADPNKLGQIIDDLFDPSSELYEKTERTMGEKFKALWNKFF